MDKKSKNSEEQKSKKEIVSIVPTKEKEILVDPLNTESESLMSLYQKEVVPEEVSLSDVNGTTFLETNNIFQEVGTNYSSPIYLSNYIENNNFIGGNNMSCAAIYTANTSSQSVGVNTAVNLGTINRRFGCALNAGSTSVSISKPGYYAVTAVITFTAPATGVAAISLQQNGVQVPGATVADTVTTAVTEQNTMSLTAIVRSTSGNDTLTFVNTGIAITPSNVAVTAVKL